MFSDLKESLIVAMSDESKTSSIDVPVFKYTDSGCKQIGSMPVIISQSVTFCRIRFSALARFASISVLYSIDHQGEKKHTGRMPVAVMTLRDGKPWHSAGRDYESPINLLESDRKNLCILMHCECN